MSAVARRLLGNSQCCKNAVNVHSGQCGGRNSRVSVAAMSSAAMKDRVITLENMNPHVKKMEYAVRGPLVIRATALEKELEAVSVATLFDRNSLDSTRL